MKLKKTLVMVLAACLLVGIFAGTAFADAPDGPMGGSDLTIPSSIVKTGATVYEVSLSDGTTGVVKELDTPYTGWKQYGDNWAYYRNGRPQYHWQQIDGNWYYFQKDGFMVANGVAWVENRLFFFKENGVCDTTPGWKTTSKTYFYVYEENGTSIVYPAQGYAWFYLNENGYIQTGWNWIDGAWHMCDKETGRMLCNEWYVGEADLVYYFDQYTEMATGWMTINDALKTDKTYRFAADGHQVNGWQQDAGNWYYIRPYTGPEGYRVENSWAFIGTSAGTYWYLFDADGIMQTGWQEVITAEATTETRYENGKVYTVQVPAQTKWFYLTSWGAMMKNVQYINGTYYDFGDNGQLYRVWDYDSNTWEYFIEDEYGASYYLVPGQSDKDKDAMPSIDGTRY